MTHMEAALRFDDVHVEFGGVKAVDGVSLSVAAGALHAIIGPNGSGKTTLLNAVSGFVHATGSISLLGHEIAHDAAYRRVHRGLGRTFQNPHGDHTLTVRQLLRLGEHRHSRLPWWVAAVLPRRYDRRLVEFDARASAHLERVGLTSEVLDVRLTDLSAGVAKLVDLVRALLGEPRVLLLDEPTSGMNVEEIHALQSILSEMRASDLTVVLVEHNLDFVGAACDNVTVLASGSVLGSGTLDEVLALPQVVEAYFGASSAISPTVS